MKELAGRVAVVTGAGSGIGRALSQALAREGMRIAAADVDEAGLAETIKGLDAIAVRTDVTDLAQVQALADRAWESFGAVHVLCNNAGVAVWGGLETATHRDWQWVLGVNLWGVIHGIEAFVPRMIARKSEGHIVNTASMAGLIASQGLGVYNTSKYAVVGLSETLVKDLRPYGIGVSVLCPMGVATRIRDSERTRPAALRNAQPRQSPPVELIGRTLAPEHVADMVVAAIRRNQLYVIPPNAGMIVTDGTLKLLPRQITRGQQHCIDTFLESLAHERKHEAIGVILSGTASDGTEGLRAVKNEGGITFAQDQSTAKFDGMPRNAIAAGVVDFVLSPEEIAHELAHISRHPYVASDTTGRAAELLDTGQDAFAKIFSLLRAHTGSDFSSRSSNP